MKILFKGKIIGKVIEVFNNSEYDILIAKMNNGKELMIPDVDAYVKEKNPEKNDIIVWNIEELINL